MNSPNPRNRGTPQRAAAAPTPPAVHDPNDQPTLGLRVPTSFGSHSTFDYTTRRDSTNILVRSLLHSAITLDDITFEWESPRVLKFRIAWPEFFLKAEEMATFTTYDNGDMVFPPEHALTMDTSRRNQMLVEEDGHVYDDGTYAFEVDMKQENPIIELLDVDVPARNIQVKCLQIYAE
jgi:hypothetical protein